MREETSAKRKRILHKKGLLVEMMMREISLLREILSSMEEEQKTLLEGQGEELKGILAKREGLFKMMMDFRKKRTQLIEDIAELKGVEQLQDDAEERYSLFLDYDDPEDCEILSLKDQMIALFEKINQRNAQNNSLLQSKVSFTKEVIRRLQPSENNPTYGLAGKVQGKTKLSTMTLINHEV